MRKIVMVLLFVLLISQSVFAYTVKDVSTITEKDFGKILPGKLVSMGAMSYCEGNGNIFIMCRDDKTRKLEWYYFDPFNQKILKHGDCPFKVFDLQAVSPNGDTAVIFAKYPVSIWYLDMKTSKWQQIFKNPKGAGLAITSISPLAYVDNLWAFTIMDLRDAEGFVLDSAITYFMLNPYRLVDIGTLKRLQGMGIHNVFRDKIPPKVLFSVGDIVIGEKQSFVYVLNSKTKDEPVKHLDYLFHYRSEGKMMKLDLIDKSEPSKKGGIFPLDYQAEPMKVLYRKVSDKTNELIFFDGGKKTVILESAMVMLAKVMKDDMIGAFTVEGTTWNLYLGKAPGQLTKIKTFKDPYTVGFTSDGTKLVMINEKELRCLTIK